MILAVDTIAGPLRQSSKEAVLHFHLAFTPAPEHGPTGALQTTRIDVPGTSFEYHAAAALFSNFNCVHHANTALLRPERTLRAEQQLVEVGQTEIQSQGQPLSSMEASVHTGRIALGDPRTFIF